MKKIYLVILLIIVVFLALVFGAINVPFNEIINILRGFNSDNSFIILHYRLPRITLSILAGIAFSSSGVIMQCIVRNPLASPDILGVSNGGALGAMLALIFLPTLNIIFIPIYAICGSLTVGLILYILTVKGILNQKKLALIGISLSSVAASIVQLLIIKYPMDAPTAMIWLTGSLWGSDWSKVSNLLLYILLLLPICLILFRKMDVMMLGDSLAISLGENVRSLKKVLLVLSVLLTAVAVAYVGALGFIGLICPHMAKKMFGSEHKYLFITSSLLASILLIIADTIGRVLMPPIEVPVGVITAFIGAPYLLYLMKNQRSSSATN